MAVSEVSICNTALSKVGAKTISSLSDNSKSARLCNDLYAKCRDFMFSQYRPSFTRKRANVLVDGTAPEWEYSYRYALPADYITLIKIQDGDLYDHQIEDGYILIDKDVDINILYVYQVTDVTKFTPEFDEAIAFYLASQLAEPLKQSTTLAAKLADEAELWGMRAKHVDSRASTPISQNANDWLNSRYGGADFLD